MTLMNITQTARMLGIDRRTLYQAIKDGTGNHPPFVVIGRSKWFHPEVVQRWAKGQQPDDTGAANDQ